ncbi:MAG: hypothetical protein WDA47_03760 [Bacilli bacterium]
MMIKQTKRTGERIADFTVKLSKPEQTEYGFTEQIFSVDTCLKDGYRGVIYVGATRENWKAKEEDKVRVDFMVNTGERGSNWFAVFTITGAVHKGTPVELPPKAFTYYRKRRNGLRTCLKSFLKELIKGGYLKVYEKNSKNFEIDHLQSQDYLL